ncbi:MAG: acetolactate synthase large subunit [SAR324 cluster bacterium]|nr:acetolactate synthase large subunit [SAR324 cluster bacterium]
MTGAENLVAILLKAGVDVCFTNPGTSEMHFLAALGQEKKMRSVLALFEGVATGAADGYARMADKPACTLLHLGPGLGNGLANLHNARKARSPIVNIIGDHATHHKSNDTPLNSDIQALARPASDWVRTSYHPDVIAWDGLEAVMAAKQAPGNIATLILPADVSWGESTGSPLEINTVPDIPRVSPDRIKRIAAVLALKEPTVILMRGKALREKGLMAANQIAISANATLLHDTFIARLERGAGRTRINRLPYFAEDASKRFAGIKNLILVESGRPDSFFAYPDKPTRLVPADCKLHVLAAPEEDSIQALCDLAGEMGADTVKPPVYEAFRPKLASGALDQMTIAAAVGAFLPENAIVCDESGTSGIGMLKLTGGAPAHDWLYLTGGSIGQGLPLATGAAVACPERKVVCLSGDGGAMYTIQSLWTQARENLDITTVIFSNRSYGILNIELFRVGFDKPDPAISELFSLTKPDLNFCDLAKGMGVAAHRVTTAAEFNEQFERAVNTKGPVLIEAIL